MGKRMKNYLMFTNVIQMSSANNGGKQRILDFIIFKVHVLTVQTQFDLLNQRNACL